MTTIERIILSRDQRGISELARHMPENFCHDAAALIGDKPGTAMIITGFYILDSDSNETDGPPGAVAMGEALKVLGYKPVYVTDRYTYELMSALSGEDDVVVDFPVAGEKESEDFAENLLNPNPPKDTDGRREGSGRGWVRELQGRWPGVLG